MNENYTFKNKKSGEIITLKKEDLNNFFKVPTDKTFYYFNYKTSVKYYWNENYFRILIECYESKNKFDLEFIKEALEEGYFGERGIMNIKLLKKLNKKIKKIDKDTKIEKLVKIFNKGIFTDIELLSKDFEKYNFGDRMEFFRFLKFNKKRDKHIFNLIFNKLDIYSDFEFIKNDYKFI